MKQWKNEIYILDTYAILFKEYYAINMLYNRDDFPTNVLMGFVKVLLSFQKKIKIQNLIFALEGDGENFRNEIDSNYKANRGSRPVDFEAQAKVIIDWIQQMGYSILKENHFEADDVIASFATEAESQGYRVFIISPDKDFNQLINENISILKIDTKGNFSEFNSDSCIEKFGVLPEQFIDFQALVGDTVDNIFGVAGIGQVTAKKLLKDYKNLEEIYLNLDNLSPSVRKKLDNGKNDAFKSRELVTLYLDIYSGINLNISQMLNNEFEPFLKIVDSLISYEINEPIKYLLKKGLIDEKYISKREKKGIIFKSITLTTFSEVQKVLNSISKQNTIVAFDTETTGLNQFEAKIVGFSFAVKEDKGYYIPINHNSMLDLFAEQMSFEDAKKSLLLLSEYNIVGHNIKYDLNIIFNNFGIELISFADTMVFSWLINPDEKNSLDFLAYKYLKHKTIKFSDVVAKGETFASVELSKASEYAVEDVIVTFQLYYLLVKLLPTELNYLINEVENKFPNVLFRMEQAGFKIDIKLLQQVKIEIEQQIQSISTEIIDEAGIEFNLNSPKQVSHLLYERLKLKSRKKNTTEETLLKIKSQHVIVEKILLYRNYSKLLSSYIEPLLKYGQKGRIRTSFFQTGTVTGRLASRDPNLQTIPIRRESGLRIRESFIAEDGNLLLSLDYSQIELRFLAYFSRDETLIEIFEQGGDVHQMVAEKLGIERRVAKTVNFGLIYGMGIKKLAQVLQIKEKEAKSIFANYFETFPTIKEFLSKTNDNSNLVATTICLRKRYFYPNSYQELDMAKREIFNSIFQGSTADLIKLAMVKIDEVIYKEKLPAKMLLQIHDELIFEVQENQIEQIKNKFKTIMENQELINGIKIDIPIVVNAKIGKNWRFMK